MQFMRSAFWHSQYGKRKRSLWEKEKEKKKHIIAKEMRYGWEMWLKSENGNSRATLLTTTTATTTTMNLCVFSRLVKVFQMSRKNAFLLSTNIWYLSVSVNLCMPSIAITNEACVSLSVLFSVSFVNFFFQLRFFLHIICSHSKCGCAVLALQTYPQTWWNQTTCMLTPKWRREKKHTSLVNNKINFEWYSMCRFPSIQSDWER